MDLPNRSSAPQEGGRMFQRGLGWPELVHSGESRVGEEDSVYDLGAPPKFSGLLAS